MNFHERKLEGFVGGVSDLNNFSRLSGLKLFMGQILRLKIFR